MFVLFFVGSFVLEFSCFFCVLFSPVLPCSGHKYKCDKEAVCRELHKKVKWVNKEVVKSTRECEERQVCVHNWRYGSGLALFLPPFHRVGT